MNAPTDTCADVDFTLTVPGTDDRLDRQGNELVAGDARFYQLASGIWDLTSPRRRAEFDRFAVDYAAVRRSEGRELDPEAIRRLPEIDADHPLAELWRHRRRSWHRLASLLPTPGESSRCAVDLGAGCGWLAARLAELGWKAAALDITVDGGDGLASARHHSSDLLLIRADMALLPFASASVDLAVFNAALHYAGDVDAALREARRVLRPDGALVVLDSPLFNDPVAGAAMVEEFEVETRARHGIDTATHLGTGFITWTELAPFGFDRHDEVNAFKKRFHRRRGARRAGREVAQRPLLIANPAARGHS